MTNAEEPKSNSKPVLLGIGLAGCLAWAITVTALLVNQKSESVSDPVMTSEASSMMTGKTTFDLPNPCNGAKVILDDAPCITEALDDGGDVTEVVLGPQAGANVTSGYNGQLEVSVSPLTVPYYQGGLCPVNVHWHLGTEHYSAGQYDCVPEENKCGPTPINERRKLAGKSRQGFQCNFYDESDEKFTKPYEWKHCDSSMEVGQTYEVHWPHSIAGDCGTPHQYQTPFYDGLFCNLDRETFLSLPAQAVANAVGVQAQIFTIVNDEDYFYPDLLHGMLVIPSLDFGTDLAIYTGSSTSDKRNNTSCSSYTPITWQVDRKCHMISASSFDKLCLDMKSQNDDMSNDLHAHGSRELVADNLAANNHATRNLRA